MGVDKGYYLEYSCYDTGNTHRFKVVRKPNKAPVYEREDGRKFTRNKLISQYEFVGHPRREAQVWVTNPVNGFKYRLRKEK